MCSDMQEKDKYTSTHTFSIVIYIPCIGNLHNLEVTYLSLRVITRPHYLEERDREVPFYINDIITNYQIELCLRVLLLHK